MAPIWASSAINWQAIEYNTNRGLQHEEIRSKCLPQSIVLFNFTIETALDWISWCGSFGEERSSEVSMILSKAMAGSLIAIVFIGFAPNWVHASEAVKTPAGDRIVVPTRIKPLH